MMLAHTHALLVASAHAQDAASGGASQPPAMTSFAVQMLLLVLIFYFLIIRPQQKRHKQHRAMIQSVTTGDQVLTAGGIIGTITQAEEGEDVVLIQIADGVTIRVSRATLSHVYQQESDATSASQGSHQSPASRGKKDRSAKSAQDSHRAANNN